MHGYFFLEDCIEICFTHELFITIYFSFFPINLLLSNTNQDMHVMLTLRLVSLKKRKRKKGIIIQLRNNQHVWGHIAGCLYYLYTTLFTCYYYYYYYCYYYYYYYYYYYCYYYYYNLNVLTVLKTPKNV